MKIFSLVSLLIYSGIAKSSELYINQYANGFTTITTDIVIDKKIKRFQVDLGASKTSLILDEQTKNYTTIGDSKSIGLSGAPQQCKKITIPTVIIDSTNISNFQVGRCDTGLDFNNLGIDAFENRILSLDFKKKELNILNKLPTNWIGETFDRIDSGQIKLNGLIDQKKINMIFDTGAQMTTIDSSFIEKNLNLFKYIMEVNNGYDSTGKELKLRIYYLNELKIGKVSFKQIPISSFKFNDQIKQHFGENTPIILGANTIVYLNWIFDFQTQKWSASN